MQYTSSEFGNGQIVTFARQFNHDTACGEHLRGLAGTKNRGMARKGTLNVPGLFIRSAGIPNPSWRMDCPEAYGRVVPLSKMRLPGGLH
jgi:hypothetical protein